MPAEPADPRVEAVAAAIARGLGYTPEAATTVTFMTRAITAIEALDAYDREHPEQVPWLEPGECGYMTCNVDGQFRVRSDG